jgi:predicted 2-oxoglutarate/Fe(II)-dependent dioxygenase YbiX
MASDIGEFIATLKFVLDGKGLEDAAKKADEAGKKTSLLDEVSNRLVFTFGDLQTMAKNVGAAIWSFAEAAGESELMTKRLSDAMKAQGIYSNEALKANEDYAQSLQDVTIYNDEVIKSSMQLLTTFGLHDDKLRTTTKAASDLASSLGIDLRTASMLLGKAFTGETSTLSRYGIIIDDNVPKSARFAEVLKQVQERFGGAAQGEAETFSGKLEQMKNTFDDLKETIGVAVLPALKDFFDAIKNGAKDVSDFIPTMKAYATTIESSNSKWKETTGLSAYKKLLQEVMKLSTDSGKFWAEAIRDANKDVVDNYNASGAQIAATVGTGSAKIVQTKKNQSLSEIQIAKQTANEIRDHDAKTRKFIEDGMKEEIAAHQRKEEQKRKASRETMAEIEGLVSAYGTVLANFSSYETTLIQNQLTTDLEAEQTRYDEKKDWIEKNVADETSKTQQLANLEQDHADREKALQKDAQNRQAEANKKMKPLLIAQAMANTAVGVTKAFAEGGLLGFVTGALVAAAGAIEIAKIDAQQFAKGVKDFAGGWALVGEGLGEELVNLPAGSDVYNRSDTRRMLAGGMEGSGVDNSKQEINVIIQGNVDDKNVDRICSDITNAIKKNSVEANRMSKAITKRGASKSGEAV